MPDKQKQEVILIEDDAADAELTIHILKKNKMANNLVHLRDGKEAVDFIFAKNSITGMNLNDIPGLILLDLKMPRFNGMEVLKLIKKDERTRNIPVVVFTSSKEKTDIDQCYDLGVNSYIVKPIDFESFAKTIVQIGMYWLSLNLPFTGKALN